MDRFDRYWIGILIGLILPAAFGLTYIDVMNLCVLHHRHLAPFARCLGGGNAIYPGVSYRDAVMIPAAVDAASEDPKTEERCSYCASISFW